MRSAPRIAGLFALLLGITASLRANTITYTGTGTNILGNTISASATFDMYTASGVNHLTLTLTNTYTSVIHAGGADVLTGLFFNPEGDGVLTATTDGLSSGSVMLPTGTDPGVLATNWGFTVSPGTVAGSKPGDYAIGATGLIGGSSTYDFTGIYHHSSGFLGGPNYGIVGNALDTYGGFSPLVAGGIVFNFTYTGTISSFSDVSFLYGTASGEGIYPDA